ncbi:MAG: hypothetical protein AUH01_06235 [Acidobacteria bacterium 13_2_20CM_56_17]|nr:MAG: hypothetical protein AUH01_06235 [Acidobacteria bacterium 13_2_20CM_56_17]
MFPNPLSIRLRLFNFKSPREWTGRHNQKTFANLHSVISRIREKFQTLHARISSQRRQFRFDSLGQQESGCGTVSASTWAKPLESRQIWLTAKIC